MSVLMSVLIPVGASVNVGVPENSRRTVGTDPEHDPELEPEHEPVGCKEEELGEAKVEDYGAVVRRREEGGG